MEKIVTDLVELLESKKAEDITVIDIKDVFHFADTIIIVTANSTVHSSSLGKYVMDFFRENNYSKYIHNPNPNFSNPWVLIDASDIIVNIFLKDAREFYNLEKLYYNGKIEYQSK